MYDTECIIHFYILSLKATDFYLLITQIAQYHRQRVSEFQKSLILYAEAQVKTGRDLVALLAKDMSTIQQLVPQDPDYKPLY